jgi:hypothetical protein
MTNPDKDKHFAIGTSPEHYWLITGLAQGKGINRTKMLSDIIDHYIKCTFAGEKA